jgi:hypothetical protein
MVIVDGTRATFSFDEGASITIGGNSAFIYSGLGDGIITSNATGAFKVKLLNNPLEATQGTDAHIAVQNYQLGANFADVAPHVSSLYVLDKVTITAASVPGTNVAGSPRIIPLGEVDFIASNSAVFANANSFQFTADTVLTSSTPAGVTIAVPNNVFLPTFSATAPLTIVPPDTTTSQANLTIRKIEGPETVTISTTGTQGIGTLSINEVAALGDVVVNTSTLGTTSNTNTGLNIGTVAVGGSITANGITSTAHGTSNAGSVRVTAGTFNSGTINIPNNAVGGSITIVNSATNNPAIPTPVYVGVNSGLITFDATTAGFPLSVSDISVADNKETGEIRFGSLLTGGAGNFLKAPVNNGLINFTDNVTIGQVLGDTTSPAVPANRVAGSGTVVFGGRPNITAATVIGCDVEFKAGSAITAATTLGGNVTLGYEQDITLGTANLTLGAGKTIFVGEYPVLAAGREAVVLTPSTNPVLTAGAESDPDVDDFVGNKTLTVTVGTIAITSGDLRVPGVLGLGITSGVNIASTVTPGGSLTLEEGGILAFPATGTNIAFPLDATSITGAATASRLTASNGPVSFAKNRISGNGSTLEADPEMVGRPVITVDPNTATGSKTLTIAGVNLNLAEEGGVTLVIQGFTTPNFNKVILSGGPSPARITLGDGQNELPINTRFLTGVGTPKPSLSGNGRVGGAEDILPATVGYLTALDTGSLIITANTANITLPPTSGTVTVTVN